MMQEPAYSQPRRKAWMMIDSTIQARQGETLPACPGIGSVRDSEMISAGACLGLDSSLRHRSLMSLGILHSLARLGNM